MENNKSKRILGIVSIIWGALLLVYQILRNSVLNEWYSNTYMKHALTYGKEKAQQFQEGFTTMNNFINLAFIIALVLIVILLIIYYKKRNIKIFSKETPNGAYCIYFGLVCSILLGANLISMIAVLLGGILLVRDNK